MPSVSTFIILPLVSNLLVQTGNSTDMQTKSTEPKFPPKLGILTCYVHNYMHGNVGISGVVDNITNFLSCMTTHHTGEIIGTMHAD